MQENPNTIDRDHLIFPVQLNLKPYVEYWRMHVAPDRARISADTVTIIEQTLQDHPFLLEPTCDPAVFEPFRAILRMLFAPMFPAQDLHGTMQALSPPFYHKHVIVATPSYERIINDPQMEFRILDNSEYGGMIDYRILYAYKFILKKFYDLDIKVDQPIVASLLNTGNGLRRYFKLTGTTQFLHVTCQGELPVLDHLALQHLLDKKYASETWGAIIPPEKFVFSGLSTITLVDITIEQATSNLQYLLLNRQGQEDGWLMRVSEEMRNLFRLPQLRLGLAARQANGKMNFTSLHPLWNSLLIKEIGVDPSQYVHSAYQEVQDTQQNLIIEDLEKHPMGQDPYGKAILKAGYRNLLLTPLVFNDELIGILELTSPDPGAVDGFALFKISRVKSMFAHALKFHLEEFENRVEVTMLEHFTAIHPSIRWRFREAAISILEQRHAISTDPEIVFEHVHPFFGTLDIRDSSRKRNAAVERDLTYQLYRGNEILRQGYQSIGLEILGELMSQVEVRLQKTRAGLTSGDELALSEFLRNEVNPVISHLGRQYPDLKEPAESYLELVHGEAGICILNRTAYETALASVNACINEELDREEADVQRLYPCYFEKFRTDGVEYNIYAGASITPHRSLDPLYIDNLRLRQLIWTCRIVQKTRTLQETIGGTLRQAWEKTALTASEADPQITCIEIAPLVFAYGNTITLKFRPDEKRLDVEGAYNVRYEILKKRLDKAVIEGTQERLTQPDHLSLVFGGDQDADAYLRHLDYLVAKGYLAADRERVTLEPMQGAKGLHAIRARIL